MGDYDVPLVDLGLVPSAVMTFAWHPEVAEEVSQQGGRMIRWQILIMLIFDSLKKYHGLKQGFHFQWSRF